MKKLLQMLLPLVAIMALAMPSVASAQTTCSIKVVGEDGYGDGWNDGSLAIVQGGTIVATFNASGANDGGMQVGAYDSTTVTVSNAPVSFVWTSGDYDEEVTIWIYDGGGALVYTVNEPSAGTIYTMNTPCPACIAPSGLAAAVSGSDVDITWNAGSASSWQIVWGVGAFNPDTVTVNSDVTSTSSYSFTSLEDGMYTAYVRTDCGTDGYSTWVPVHFNIGVLIMNMATSGTQTISTCNGTIYDNGGPNGQYSSSISLSTLVITPTDSTQWVTVSGSSYTESTWDYLTIYDGVGTSGEVLWTDNGIDALTNFGPFSSSAITVTFHSDGSVTRDGFQINVSCMDAPTCLRPETFVVDAVDSSSVTFSWSDQLNSAWNIYYGPTGFALSDTSSYESFIDTTGTVGGLMPNTVYDFYLVADCGGEVSLSRMVTARTGCAPVHTLPWSEDFAHCPTGSSVQFDPCWSIYNTYSSTYNYPYVSNGYLYMYLYSSSSMSSQYGYAVLPEFDENIMEQDLEISFDIWGNSTSSYGRGVIVALFDSLENSTPVIDTVAIIVPVATSQASAETHYVSFVGHVMTGKRIGFFYQNQNPGATGSYYYTYIDNVNVHEAPSCIVPTNLTLNYAASDTLDLSWTDGQNSGATYWVEYRPSGAADTVQWLGIEATDTNVVLDGLSANTSYDIMVRALCGGDDTSFAVTGTYRTACGIITTLPWIETFNSMSTTSSATNIPCWDYIGAGGYVNITSSYSHTSNCVRFYPNGSSTTDHVLVLPEFETPISDLQMSFWTRPESSSNSGSFSVGYVTNPASDSSFVEVLNIPCAAGTTVTQYEVLFVGAPAGSRIAMRHNVGSTAWYWYVDDIDVHIAPECNHPVALSVLGSTATEATIGWGGDEDATFRVWYTAGSTCDTSSVAYVDIDSTHYTITGLTENTTYTAVVATICDDGSLTSTLTITFVTPEMGIDLPYATGFEATEDTAWVFANGTQSNQWFIGSAAGNPGNGLYISNDNGATNSYTITSTTNVYAYRSFNFTAGQYAVSFDWKAQGESCCDYLRAYLAPASDALTAGTLFSGIGTTGTPTGWIALDGDSKMNVNNSWTTQQGVAIVPANATYRLVFVWHNDGSVGTAPAAAIDNISIVQLTCPQPTALVVDSTSTNSLDVSWTAGGSETQWKVRIDNGAWQTVNTTPSYQFTGLPSGTNHFIEVQAVCGADDESFVTSLSAATLCAPISNLPFTENFNSWGTGVTPNCWSNAPSYSPTSYGRISSSYNCSGSTGGSVYMYSSSTLSNKTYLSLPELDTVTYHPNQLQLVFSLFYTSSSYGRPAIEVGVMSDPNSAASFVPVDTVQHSGALSTWEIFEVPMASYTGNGNYVAVRTAFDSAYSYFYLDDVTLELIPTCPRPDSLTASNATTNTIDLGWHERGGASEWIVEYGPRGFQLGTGTTVVANSNPFTLTGLPSSFQGEYYVKSVCGAGDTGEYSRMGCAFGTTQVPATLPYNYDFENVTEWNNWQTSTNHETNNWYRGTSVADSGSYAMYIAAGDTASYFSYAFNAVVNAAVYRDIDFGPVDSSYTLSFRARAGGTTTAAYDGLMVFLVDPSIATTASTSNITTPWGNVNDLYRIASVRLDTTWQTYEASFDTISGIHRVAFFWFNQNTDANNHPNIPQPAAVDNIHIKYSSCPRPVSLSAIVSEGGVAYLSWQGASNANYEITYRAIGDTVNHTLVATTNSYNLTGLQAPANYVYWVRKLCGAGDTSLYSDGYQFTTPCASVNAFPWVESFENEAVFDCWAQDGPGTWQWGTGDYSTSTGAADGTHNIHIQHSTSGNVTKIISPVLQLNGTDATLIFQHIQREWAGDQDELNVYYRTDQTSQWVLLANYPDQISTWTTDTITLPNTTSTYQIAFEMVDGYGYGVAIDSVVVIGQAGAACADPVVNMAATVVGENGITLSFSGEAMQYEIGYVEGDTWTVPATTVNIADTFYTFNGLTAETQYTFGVRALCSASNMSAWTTVTLTTEAHPCFTPTGVSAINVSYSGATIFWTEGENETEWEVNINSTSPVFDTTINVQGTPQVVVTGLMDNVDYAVTVRAVCAPGRLSEPSVPYTLHTSTCDAPTNLQKSEVTSNSAVISWQGAANHYQIEYGMTGFNQGEGTMIEVENTTANLTTTYELTGLAPQSPYDVYVRSICADGVNSTWSPVLQFTTSQVGIDDVNANANISLYPNPASHMVTISGIEGTATVTVIDLNGRQIGQWRVENGEQTIDVSTMAKGAYFVRIAGESTVAVRKLVVK